MSLGILELLFRVEVRSRVASMLANRPIRPRLEAGERLEARIVTHEIHGQLPSHDQLLEKGITIASRRRRVPNREGHGVRPNLAEVKVRREPAGTVDFRPVAVSRISAETFSNKLPQRTERRISAATKRAGGTHRSIDMKLVDEFTRSGKRLEFAFALPGRTRRGISYRLKKLRQTLADARTDS